jgi:hypothetical protein
MRRSSNVTAKEQKMKHLYRLVISGWWPVALAETEAASVQQSPRHLKALYEDCEVNPYDLDDLRVTLEPATEADIAKYGDRDGDNDTEGTVALRGAECGRDGTESGSSGGGLARNPTDVG